MEMIHFLSFLVLIWSTSVIRMETGFQQGLEELLPFLIFKPLSISPPFSQALEAA